MAPSPTKPTRIVWVRRRAAVAAAGATIERQPRARNRLARLLANERIVRPKLSFERSLGSAAAELLDGVARLQPVGVCFRVGHVVALPVLGGLEDAPRLDGLFIALPGLLALLLAGLGDVLLHGLGGGLLRKLGRDPLAGSRDLALLGDPRGGLGLGGAGMGLVRLDQHRPRHPAIAVMHLPLLIHPAKDISTSDADGSGEYQDGKGYESRHKKDLPASAVSPADPARPFELRHITAAPDRCRCHYTKIRRPPETGWPAQPATISGPVRGCDRSKTSPGPPSGRPGL